MELNWRPFFNNAGIRLTALPSIQVVLRIKTVRNRIFRKNIFSLNSLTSKRLVYYAVSGVLSGLA